MKVARTLHLAVAKHSFLSSIGLLFPSPIDTESIKKRFRALWKR